MAKKNHATRYNAAMTMPQHEEISQTHCVNQLPVRNIRKDTDAEQVFVNLMDGPRSFDSTYTRHNAITDWSLYCNVLDSDH